jgi:Amidohydrolase family
LLRGIVQALVSLYVIAAHAASAEKERRYNNLFNAENRINSTTLHRHVYRALAAATFESARAFGFFDRGRIAEGLRADLVLVKGDPISEIPLHATSSESGSLGSETKGPPLAIDDPLVEFRATIPAPAVLIH